MPICNCPGKKAEEKQAGKVKGSKINTEKSLTGPYCRSLVQENIPFSKVRKIGVIWKHIQLPGIVTLLTFEHNCWQMKS